ncbi:MAG: NADP-dependent oxidoreductase [Myxococcota bacterium]
MRAVIIDQYGGPEVLRIAEAPEPEVRAHDVLIRVVATSVNPVDYKIRSGGQRNIIRYSMPWILGLDVSGVVEAVGAKVTRFKVGDEVWSSPRHTRPGCYADRIAIHEAEVGRKPKNLSHEEAASIPLVGLTAYQCLVEKGRLAAGQRVLVHAGAGGVGSFAIQLAKSLGAEVSTTCSPKNEALCRSLGAHEVIDYRTSKITALAPFDLILDSVGESAFQDNLAALRPGGRISNITVDVPRHVARYGPVLSLFTLAGAMIKMHLWPLLARGIRFRHVVKRCDGRQLEVIADLVERGAIKPVIDRVLPLEEIQEAHRISESHHARGKIVLRVASI